MLTQLQSTYSAHQKELSTISDSLSKMRKEYGIYDTKTQAEALTTLEIKNPRDPNLRTKIDKYSTGLAPVDHLESAQSELSNGLAELSLQIQQLETAVSTKSTSIHIIEEAALPLEKSRPKRSLFVLAAMIIVGAMVSLMILTRHQIAMQRLV